MINSQLMLSNIQESQLSKQFHIDTVPQKKDNQKQSEQIKLKRKIKKFQKSILYLILFAFLVFYIIFSEPFRLWLASQSNDIVFNVFSSIAFCFFVLDIILQLLSKNSYFESIRFIFELINTISILLDISWLYERLFVCKNCRSYQDISYAGYYQEASAQSLVYFKIVRFIRLLRVLYFIRFTKFFKALQQQYSDIKSYRQNKKLKGKGFGPSQFTTKNIEKMQNRTDQITQEEAMGYLNPNLEDFNIKYYQEVYDNKFTEDTGQEKFRNLSSEITYKNIQRIMIIVLILLALLPLFYLSTFIETYSGQRSDLNLLGNFVRKYGLASEKTTHLFQSYINTFKDLQDRKLLQLTIYSRQANNSLIVQNRYGMTEEEKEIILNRRTLELINLAYPVNVEDIKENELFVTAIIDRSKVIQECAWLYLLMILTAIFILFFISFFIDRDSNKLIVEPFHDMMKKIQQILKNPVEASKIAEKERFQNDLILQKDLWRRMREAEQEQYETSLLIKTLQKSGNLLALGFGEAGTKIIIKNLEQDKLNPLMKGQKVICIFGFCDIKYFSELTEILKKDVLLFVNTIAEIVHFEVNRYGGSSNKNLGDAFLLVWKFPEVDVEEVIAYDEDGIEKRDINLKNYVEQQNSITSRCELAVLSYLKIIIHIKRSIKLMLYERKKIIKKHIPEFKIQMNFGLHMGWAIEGAIGSQHKIDASYLSPNVNLASRLESVSKQYGIPLLISGQIHEKLSQDVQNQFRLIDIVNLKGSKQAMKLYTYDMYFKDLKYKKTFIDALDEKEKKREIIATKSRKKIELDLAEQIRIAHENIFIKKIISTKAYFVQDEDLNQLRKKFRKDFFDEWNSGFQNYVKGWWQNAAESFQKTLHMIEDYEDGPSKNLLEYMKNFDNKAPSNWKGVRIMLSK